MRTSIEVDPVANAASVTLGLRHEEQAFEVPARLFEQLPFAVYLCDRDGLVLRYNRRAAELWGRSPKIRDPNERFCGSYRMFRPDGSLLPHHECPMADVLRTGVSVREQEVHIERPDGLRGIALIDIEVIKDSDGNIVGAVNCFQDITERKRGEEAALRLAAIIESSDDAIVSKDLDGTIRSWNGGAQRIFGYLAEEVIGKPIAILIPPDRHNEETAILERLRRGERIGSYETVRRRKDGSPVDVSLTVSPLKNTEGRVIGASKIARNITERLYAERALRESEARLQTAAELVGLGWSYWKPGCSDVEWDARLKAIWGLSPGAPVDLERATAAIHPDDRPKVDEIRAALTNPAINSYKAEYRVIGIEDGVERWIRTRGRTYEPGNPKAFVSGVLDITEQKRTEQTLRDKEARLQAAVDLVGLSVYSWDLWAGTVEWDDRTKALWGLPPEAEVDLALARSAIHPDDLPRLDASIAQAKDPQGEGIFRVEFRVIGINDGLERWVSSYGKTTFVDGKARGFVGAVREITQEKRAEVRLRESEARLQAAVDLVKLGRYAWNPQTNELQWDDTLRAMWGLPAGAPVDHEVWRTGVHPDDLASVEAAIQRCTDPRGDGVYEIEYRVIGKTDGVERWIGTRGQTHFENNVPVSFFGVALEVTDRKRIERRLERRVEDRTRELAEANRELRSQMEKREIAEAEVQQLQRLDAVGQITSGVAHDFNNLLSVVLTNVRLLSRTVRSADDQEGIQLIRTAADRGAKLIAQLLAFSRQQRLEPHEVDLNSKIVGMSNLLSVTLGGTVQLRMTFAPDLWPALVDPNQIELIVLNLAINARDAMQPGGTLTLETFNTIIESEPVRPEEPSPGDYVGLAVKDTGTGIPYDVLPHVFEPFFTTKEPGKGSGLGLAQVFGFAKQSGGGVRLETRLGQGTAVTIFLPRARVEVADQEADFVDASNRPQTMTGLRVLVVDDDKAVLKSTVRMLEFLGYATESAESANEALRLLARNQEINIVLADFAMPEMSGGELAKAICAMRPTLPVILITGYSDLDILKELKDSRIILKPFTEDDLVNTIDAALK